MRKYKTLILVMFFLCIFCLARVNAHLKDYSLLGRCIYLDAGHGGVDSGAISNTFLEKDMNLVLTNKLASKLFERGAMVFLTRDGDYDLSESTINRKRNDLYKRVKLINNSGCDMYISIHMNASPSGRWSGMQIFYSDVLKENKKIAKIVTDNLANNLSNVREYKKENGYYMYSKLKVPGILVEAGFVSNSHDNYVIRKDSYQDKLVNNIANGISAYFNS